MALSAATSRSRSASLPASAATAAPACSSVVSAGSASAATMAASSVFTVSDSCSVVDLPQPLVLIPRATAGGSLPAALRDGIPSEVEQCAPSLLQRAGWALDLCQPNHAKPMARDPRSGRSRPGDAPRATQPTVRPEFGLTPWIILHRPRNTCQQQGRATPTRFVSGPSTAVWRCRSLPASRTPQLFVPSSATSRSTARWSRRVLPDPGTRTAGYVCVTSRRVDFAAERAACAAAAGRFTRCGD